MNRVLALTLAALSILACGGLAADVSASNLAMDGGPWALESCYNGASRGFMGIELVGMDKARVRFESRADGKVNVYLMEPGGAEWIELGDCGTMSFEETNVTVNDVKGLRGGGTVQCEGGAHTLTGTVQVDRCATDLF